MRQALEDFPGVVLLALNSMLSPEWLQWFCRDRR
jgi:hypothetical protein